MAPKRKPASKKATPAPAPDARKKHDDEALTATLVERTEAGEKTSAVAKDIGITGGKAAFLLLVHEADTNPKLQIKVKTKDDAPAAITEARDEKLLSWGQIAARLRVAGKRLSEPTVKSMYEGETARVGVARKAARGEQVEATPKRTAKKTPAKGKAAPAPGAKKRTPRRGKGVSDPS